MRYKRLLVTPQFFVTLCREGLSNVVSVMRDGLPADARFVYVVGSTTKVEVMELVIWSASFDELAQGDEIPVLPQPKFSRLNIDPGAELELRTEWFLNHGCPIELLYQDETGEMQCNNQNIHAPADFKHDDLDTLRELVKRTRLHFAALVFTAAQADDSVKH